MASISPVTTTAQGAEQTVELGLKPSLVYDLWSNMNRAVLTFATLYSDDQVWLEQLQDMQPKAFSGKIPAHVLKRVKLFQEKLDHLDEAPKSVRSDTLLDHSLSNLLSSKNKEITPSQVYLHSGQALINMSESILYKSSSPIEISSFFKENNIIEKTPSDVFGLVDLAIRRIDAITARSNNTPLIVKD
ncbi:hypothetical protein [Kiloniella sp.]|uniref:hypothetical protein n=1 Tax=Kiloniella sp. TaxID=1938587 RepID=UPI003A918044